MLTRPMSPDEYAAAVEELAAFARAHRALAGPGHPWPTWVCLTCPWIEQRRRELARPVSGVR